MIAKSSRPETYKYSHTTEVFGLEEENKILKACVTQLQEELDRIKQAPLLVCTVKSLINGRYLVRLPNGNQFLVSKLAGCPEVQPGDTVVADQRNLVIVEKIPVVQENDVEKFLKPTHTINK